MNLGNPQVSPLKPLGHKAYGSIAHLPNSRRGPKDHGLSEGQAKICCTKARDKHDLVIVQEKLDGSNVAVAKISGEIVPLIRSGYRANTSKYEMHHHFHNWVFNRLEVFESLLSEGERCVGEWLWQAHGTRYQLPHEPFVVFDIMQGHNRQTWEELNTKIPKHGLVLPYTFHCGGPLAVEKALKLLGQGAHGALDPVEGAVWRVERQGKVDFLAKYVRPEKVDGKYLPEISGDPPVINSWAGN